jgi:hypothetical protein
VWSADGNQGERGALSTHVWERPGPEPRLGSRRDVTRKHLINRLNYLHFKDECIIINLAHRKYGSTIALRAKPLPCLDKILECVWSEPSDMEQKLKAHRILNFIVPDSHHPLLVEAAILEVTGGKVLFQLPDSCREISSRKINRHRCRDIRVQFLQNGALFHGSLIDFTPVSFHITIESIPPQSFQWVNPETPVHIVFSNDNEILYSGDCEIVKHDCGQGTRSYILRPLAIQIRRFKPKEYRSIRHRLVPSPNMIFTDPLTGKCINLKVIDLSGSGLSVEESEENSVLMPGRVIPELCIDLANSMSFRCRAQVVYRKAASESKGNRVITCGLAILDMDITEHVRLLALLHQATDRYCYICAKVDMDDLWEFFFQADFLYPRKYLHIQANKEKFKNTCEKLYSRNPHIARHFTYQKDGRIYGHIAMVRFYENTWLIHHHASGKLPGKRAGLIVLEQIGRAINDSHGLYSARMHFVMCYFRPENSFPRRVFGGIADQINDRKGCSVDAFAYFHFHKGSVEQWDLTGPWALQKTTVEDLRELEGFYRHASGGLLLHALDLGPDMFEKNDIGRAYEKADIKNEKHLFSLKKNDSLKAIFLVTVSDIGLNMSDLTNCIHTIILDEDDFPCGTLSMMWSMLSKYYSSEEISILLYPKSYAEKNNIEYENIYNLWILNMHYTDSYFKSIERMIHHANE